jgi:hypothetical protein
VVKLLDSSISTQRAKDAAGKNNVTTLRPLRLNVKSDHIRNTPNFGSRIGAL